MMRIIPLPEFVSDETSVEVQLPDKLYTLRFSWSGSAWFVSIAGVLEGARLALGWPLWLGVGGCPRLMLVSASADRSEPGRQDLGGRCQLALITGQNP